MALYLHMVVWTVIISLLPVALHLIYEAIEIVVLGSRIVT